MAYLTFSARILHYSRNISHGNDDCMKLLGLDEAEWIGSNGWFSGGFRFRKLPDAILFLTKGEQR